ncbi:hypothetical protein [Curtobacterium flaccumfaciens]|uniref:hypothetical protein n=1 Tax=Curtobacterium flaccumfaciens TaxID=2035 RepID=UPI001BE0EBB2|nr:hypothetical protein [Curtobacterium flaccumfaciens]MBT1584125.1 hypothetical protein [Curtobacterium flaccumfaciens pv. flaccumfaciens]MCS5493620.1 hypothetical protein [Curtobacterium flaccumfaciens pv. flaccumfaciens]MCX2797201.1 hypothetical protein [Curtobacterium flaccumfaciens pv. flaccumfaciens]
MSTTTPRADPDAAADDFEGGWFRIDGEVEFLDDVVWRPSTDADDTATIAGPAAVIVGGAPREHIGSTLPLAQLAEIDVARQRTVRKLWLSPINIVVCLLVVTALEVSGLPWRTDLGRQLLVGLGTALPVNALCTAIWWRITRDPSGAVVRKMGGHRTRQQYDQQRAVLER